VKYARDSVVIYIELGDITEFQGDATVNSANTSMIMGGGVAGAIKRRGGREIEKEARRYAPVPIEAAIATNARRLRVKYVIHALTVERPASLSSRENVYRATRATLQKARELGAYKVTFPLMGAGIGGLKPEESIEEVLKAIQEVGVGLEVHIVIRDPETLNRVLRAMEALGWRQV
jgi:O-acetyl-ADP-ribose deacetylase (regulator of RNase III)